MIDLTVPETGQQPRELVLAVVSESFDAALALADAGARVPQLQPSIDLARAAQDRDDVVDLDQQLADVITAAIATRVRMRASFPDLGGPSA